jgi:hypothetical protein
MSDNAPDLGKIWNTDLSFPGIGFGYASAALASYLDVLKDHVGLVTAQYRLRAERELKRQEAELHELQYRDRLFEIDDAVEKHIPQYLYNSAVVAIWGLFESFLDDLATWVARREKAKVRLDDLRGSFPGRVEKFFEGVIRFPVPWKPDQRQRLRQLQDLRNLIAHRNGRLSGLTEEKVRRAREVVERLPGVSIEGSTVYVSEAYVAATSSLVFEMLGDLNNALAEHYDGPRWIPPDE